MKKNVGAQKPVVQSCPKLILVWEKKESRNIIKNGNGKNGTANIFIVGCNYNQYYQKLFLCSK